ncbi:glycosyltransferase family 4 protein [Luteibacter rhizovicinus]|nr:glycosyltransferase family 4 protein [Luteibacter rhizovicinus]
METYAVKLSSELATRTRLEVRALPGKTSGAPPGLLRLLCFMAGSIVVLLRKRMDVIHLGDLVMWPLALVARLKGSSQRIVMTAYGLDLVFGRRRGILPWLYGRYLALGVRLVGRSVRIIAISGPTACLCKEAGFTDVTVVTLGVDVAPRAFSDPRHGEPFILFVGRLVKRKGAAWFANEVMPLLPGNLRLVVVGKCWDRNELDVLRDSPRIEYREFVSSEELLALRSSALVVIMPNIPSGGVDVEGFGLTALEAAADGGVLLASGIEGIVDAVIDHTTGFLLPAGDAVRWAEKIEEIRTWSQERRTAFIRGAREVIVSLYSWRVVAERTLEAYRSGS